MAGRSPHDRAQYHVRGKAGCRPIVGRAGVAGPQPASQADHRRRNGCGEAELAALQQSPGDQQKVIALAEGLLSGATTGCR